MFSLIRLVMFTLIAFAAGVFYEKAEQTKRCEAAGAEIANGGICMKAR